MTSVDTIILRPTNHKRNPAAKLRLFCFPYAGGGALTYKHWSKALPAEIEVFPVQLPGRGSRLRESPFIRMEPLVNSLLRELRGYMDKPFAFFGHSMGAVIGFEMARLLRREGAALPVHLFVSGRSAPRMKEPEAPTYNLPDAELIQELMRLKGTPAEVLEHPELMQVILPIVRADFELIQTYTYTKEAPLNVPLTTIGGFEDEGTSRAKLEGWQAETSGAFSVRMLPGDHFYLTTNQQLLLPILASELYQEGWGETQSSSVGSS